MRGKKIEGWLKVVAEIVRIQGNAACSFNHKVGEVFEFKFSTPKTCTYAYYALRPAVDILLHGGWFPWTKKGETIYCGCPHPGKAK